MPYTVLYRKKYVKLFRKEQKKIFSRKQMSCFRENNLIIYSAKRLEELPQPLFWVQFSSLFSQLELQDSTLANGSDGLTSTHFLSSTHTD